MKLQISKEENWYICKFNFCKIQQLKHFDNAFAPQFDLYALKFLGCPKNFGQPKIISRTFNKSLQQKLRASVLGRVVAYRLTDALAFAFQLLGGNST